MKNHKYWLIKNHRVYTIKEISKLLQVHIDTVRNWIKQGLKTVPKTRCPILIKGENLKRFLEKQAKARKCKLKDNQFYCLRCHQIRKSNSEKIRVEIFERFLSEGNRKAIIYGVCEVCGLTLRLFSSVRVVNQWLDQGWISEENVVRRYEGNKSSGNSYSQSDIITNPVEVSHV